MPVVPGGTVGASVVGFEDRDRKISHWESPDACSRALSISLNHKEIASIMAVTGTILPKQYANVITRHEQKKKYCPMLHLLEINENK